VVAAVEEVLPTTHSAVQAVQAVADLLPFLAQVDLQLLSLAVLVLLERPRNCCLPLAQAESPHTLAVPVAAVADTEAPLMEAQRQGRLALSLAAVVVAGPLATTGLRLVPAVLVVLAW